MAREPSAFKLSELTRAVRACKRAGFERVEIYPEKIVGMSGSAKTDEQVEATNPFDAWRARRGSS